MKAFKGLMLAMAFLLVASFASAASWIDPASSGRMYDTYTVNISTGIQDPVECGGTVASSLTANTSETINLTNASPYNAPKTLFFNGSMVTNDFEDGSDYTLTFTCHNSTTKHGGSNSTSAITVSNVVIDNGAPTVPTSLSPADGTVDTDGDVTFSATVSGENTTACTLTFDPGRGSSIPAIGTAMVHSGDSCTLSADRLQASNAGYYWTVTASDGLNSTSDDYNKLQIDTGGNAAQKAMLLQQMEDDEVAGSSTVVWIVLIAFAAYLYKSGKLTGKKR